MESITKPVFILCVGAQKTGTSWLFKQLSGLSEVDFGLLKEYHIWDALHVSHCYRWIAKHKSNEDPLNVIRRLMQLKEGVYEAYFRSLIYGSVRFTGDFTPSYSILNGLHFVNIKERLENVGFAVKVIFLMRDPVRRNWSALRFYNRGAIQNGTKKAESLVAEFKSFYKTIGAVDRTSYHKTMLALGEAFSEEEVFIGFYEELFKNTTISELAKFLGIEMKSVNLEEKINSSKKIQLPEKEYDDCNKFFSDVYKFCNNKFPKTKDLWTRN